MSQHSQLAVNEVFQHCGMLIHNPKFTLKWISFCSLFYYASTHQYTHTRARKWGGGLWNVNEVSSSGSPDGRRDGLLFSACSYLAMIESLPAVCVCLFQDVCVQHVGADCPQMGPGNCVCRCGFPFVHVRGWGGRGWVGWCWGVSISVPKTRSYFRNSKHQITIKNIFVTNCSEL